MISIVCAIFAGITIVLSRSVNGLLAEKYDTYQSTFYNYLTGFITSCSVFFLMGGSYFKDVHWNVIIDNPIMLMGGVIGVLNILILNVIVHKVSPIQLTLINFIAQLIGGMILDYCFYQMFSIQKVIGCSIVIIGLIIYQYADKKYQ